MASAFAGWAQSLASSGLAGWLVWTLTKRAVKDRRCLAGVCVFRAYARLVSRLLAPWWWGGGVHLAGQVTLDERGLADAAVAHEHQLEGGLLLLHGSARVRGKAAGERRTVRDGSSKGRAPAVRDARQAGRLAGGWLRADEPAAGEQGRAGHVCRAQCAPTQREVKVVCLTWSCALRGLGLPSPSAPSLARRPRPTHAEPSELLLDALSLSLYIACPLAIAEGGRRLH